SLVPAGAIMPEHAWRQNQRSPGEDRMSARRSNQTALVLAAAAMLLTGVPVAGQERPQAGERIIGGPPNPEIGTRMRGVPQPPFPTAAEKLPLPMLKLPAGFRVEVYISGLTDARSLRVGDKGTVFVSN